jgi:hypothetical protein
VCEEKAFWIYNAKRDGDVREVDGTNESRKRKQRQIDDVNIS